MAASNASKLIDQQIAGLPDWRGKLLAKLRALVLEAEPNIVEEWKWGPAVWTRDGMVCAAGAFKEHVKLNFFQGASLADPKQLFNAGLDAKTTRSIDFQQGDKVDAAGVKALVRAALAYNARNRKPAKKT
jgi:hypothetical protein